MELASKRTVAALRPLRPADKTAGPCVMRPRNSRRFLAAALLLTTLGGCTPEGSAPRADLDMGQIGRSSQRGEDAANGEFASSIAPPLLTDLRDTQSSFAQSPSSVQLGQPNLDEDLDSLSLSGPADGELSLDDTATFSPSDDRPFGGDGEFRLAATPVAPQSPTKDDVAPEIVPTPPAMAAIPIEVIPTPDGDADSTKETPTAPASSDAAPRISLGPNAADSKRRLEESQFPGNSLRPGQNDLAFKPGDRLRQAPAEPVDYTNWVKPDVTLVFTGQQHGYIEPCGCTGLERQKGGVARRYSFMDGLKKKGWVLAPIDTGNLVRRVDSQGTIKFHRSLEALRSMGYVAVGFGPDDVRLSATDLIQEAAAEKREDQIYASANVVLIDPELMPRYQVVERGGIKIGITSVLDPDFLETDPTSDVIIEPPLESTTAAMKAMNTQSPRFRVLTYFGTEETGQELVRKVKGFDLLVVSGGYGEPTFQPVAIDGTDTKMIVTGNKGMYAGLVGIYSETPFQYARVPLTHEFSDAPEMRRLMKEYQDQLRDLGLDGLGLKPIRHPKNDEFVGSATCGKCHTSAFEVWESSAHNYATDSIVEPPEDRGDVPRHFDPECLSCHVTGWNPQNYFPYASGYLSLEKSAHLTGNGCENCHGPGAQHSTAELEDSGIAEGRKLELREAMRLPLAKARDKCMECHDLDNSPDFHDEDAFEDVYWPQVEHYGMD